MSEKIKEISVSQLDKYFEESLDFQLLDVREPDEYKIANLKGELIPMNTVPQNVKRISRNRPVIVHCRSGVRSANTIAYLQKEHGFDNLYNLKGGILAWSDEINPDIPKY